VGRVRTSAMTPDAPSRPIEDLSALPEEDRQVVCRLAGGEAHVRWAMYSDLHSSGRYGRTRFILTDEALLVAEEGQGVRRFPLSRLRSVYCREFVGNAVLVGRLQDGGEVDLIRYSKTFAEPFQEAARRLNALLGLDEEALQAQEEAAAKVSAPHEEGTYRCPNCGHPLTSAGDVCLKCASKGRLMRRLLSFLKDHKGLAVAGALLSVAGTAFQLAPGILMKHLVDQALNVRGVAEAVRRQRLVLFVGCFFVVIFVRMVVQHFRIRVMGMLGESVVFNLRQRLYRALQRLSLSYFDREHTGRIMARVLQDTRGIQQFIVMGLQNSLIYALLVLAIPIVLFATNWRLAAVSLLPIPLVALLGRVFSGRFRTIYRTIRRRFASLSAAVSDTISGVRVVKSFAQEERELDDFDQKGRAHFNAHVAAIHARARFSPSVIFLMGLGTLAVWLYGGGLVIRGEAAGGITLGTLFLFFSYMNMLYMPVQQLMQLTEIFQSSAASAERIFSIMDMPRDVTDHDRARDLERVRGHIVLENVSFKYEDGERVLKDINLEIKPGEMLGLVGPTGSGKSTLVSLICRFYDPDKGRILLDGLDLRDIKVKSLRQNIGMVLQETFLFEGTLRENIAYGKPDASDEEIIEAAKAANAHEFIMGLPDGYDTEVGERGVGLSGGEKQRIAIARAILKNPPILILDEATSAVDTATELSIQQAMDRLVKGRTTIAIAHRLSTLRNADKLVVMDKGEIIEQGTHEELIARGGEYAKLCRIQANFAKEVKVVY